MNLRVWSGAIPLLLLSSILFAADPAGPPQPGQLAGVKLAALPNSASDAANSAATATSVAGVEDSHERMMNRLWIASMVAAVAATGLDAASSWGKLESNPLLAGGNGTFGAKGAAIKAGVAAAVIIPQIWLRKRKDLRSAFTIGNLGEASLFSAAAIHNLKIRAASSQ